MEIGMNTRFLKLEVFNKTFLFQNRENTPPHFRMLRLDRLQASGRRIANLGEEISEWIGNHKTTSSLSLHPGFLHVVPFREIEFGSRQNDEYSSASDP
jgi:hypothetical protein